MSALPGQADSVGGRATQRTQVRYARLALRFASGVVLVPFLLGVAYFGDRLPINGVSVVYGILICAACGYAAYEVRAMLRSDGYQALDVLVIGLAIVLPLDTWLRGSAFAPAPEGGLLILLFGIGGLIWLVLRPASEKALESWALSLALALYVGGLMQFYMPLRRVSSDVPGFWVIALLALSWVCDSFAYFVGGAVGRARLAPAISPNKSVEGAVAGVVGAAAVGLALSVPTGLSPLLLAGYGLVIGLATVVGDLVESLIKRHLGAKDSGVLIPGHGGLLDRMDSLMLCAPVAVVYLYTFAR